jgi:hypothetical protein
MLMVRLFSITIAIASLLASSSGSAADRAIATAAAEGQKAVKPAALPPDAMALEFWPDQELDSVLWAAGVPGECRARCVSELDLGRRLDGVAEVVLAPAAVLSNRGDVSSCLEDAEARGDIGSEAFLARCYPKWDGAALRVPLREGMAASDSEQSRFTIITDTMPQELPTASQEFVVSSGGGPSEQDGIASVGAAASEGEEGEGEGEVNVITGREVYIGASPALVALREACRVVHEQNVSWLHRKRCVLSVGAHSDVSSIGDLDNAHRLASLVARLVRFTFADGVELNFNHVHDHGAYYAGTNATDEVGAFAAFIKYLRAEFDALQPRWADLAVADLAWLRRAAPSASSAAGEGEDYYAKNIRYLETFLSKVADPAQARLAWAMHRRDKHSPKPSPYHLSIAWDVRPNAFVPHEDPVNYAFVEDASETSDSGRTIVNSAGSGLLAEGAPPAAAAPEQAEGIAPPPVKKETKKKSAFGFSVLKSLGAMLGVPSLSRPKTQRSAPNARPTSAPTAQAQVGNQEGHQQLLEFVPSHPDETDGEGVPIWGLIAEDIDEVRCLASVQPLLGARPKGSLGLASSKELTVYPNMQFHLHKGGADFKGRLHGDSHAPTGLTAKLSLGSMLSNLVTVGGVPPEKARVLVQPHLLLPGTDAVDLLDVHVEGAETSGLLRSGTMVSAASAVGRTRELERAASELALEERDEAALLHLESVAAFEEGGSGDAGRQLKKESTLPVARRRRLAREHRIERHGLRGVTLLGPHLADEGRSAGLAYLDLRAPIMRLVPVLSAQVRSPEQ